MLTWRYNSIEGERSAGLSARPSFGPRCLLKADLLSAPLLLFWNVQVSSLELLQHVQLSQVSARGDMALVHCQACEKLTKASLGFTVTNPAEVSKTRLQLDGELAGRKGVILPKIAPSSVGAPEVIAPAQPPPPGLQKNASGKVYTGPIDCLKKTWKYEGLRGVQRGLGAAVSLNERMHLHRGADDLGHSTLIKSSSMDHGWVSMSLSDTNCTRWQGSSRVRSRCGAVWWQEQVQVSSEVSYRTCCMCDRRAETWRMM